MGIVALILPEVVLLKVPIFTGEAKLPVASLNCGVKMLPALKVPVAVKGTDIAVPEQILDTGRLLVRMALLPTINKA